MSCDMHVGCDTNRVTLNMTGSLDLASLSPQPIPSLSARQPIQQDNSTVSRWCITHSSMQVHGHDLLAVGSTPSCTAFCVSLQFVP